MAVILFLVTLVFATSSAGSMSECVQPPLECPNENITYWLYTRENRDNPHQIFAMDDESIQTAPWVKDAPVKILIHGYTGHKDFSPNTEIRPGGYYPVVQMQVGKSAEVDDFYKDVTIKRSRLTTDKKDRENAERSITKEIKEVDDFYKDVTIKRSRLTTDKKDPYMELYDYNIISVDYNPIAREPCYFQAAANTELVGKCTAQLICTLVEKHGFALPKFHVIGFSLGGQTAGFVGDYMTCGKLTRITGLDPALPLFASTNNSRKLDSGDAQFVDVLHTNALEKGKLESSGDVDFYANGGLTQPGCMANENQTKSGCDHARAPAYYAESITTRVGFYATQCYSWIVYMIGWCELTDSADEILFGEYVPYGSEGLWFFRTNSKSPYARGSNKDSSSSLQDESRQARSAESDGWGSGNDGVLDYYNKIASILENED